MSVKFHNGILNVRTSPSVLQTGYFDKKGVNFVYLYDLSTKKTVSKYTIEGKYLGEWDLSAMSEQGIKLQVCSPLNSNVLLVLDNLNKVYFVDSNGLTYRKMSFQNILTKNGFQLVNPVYFKDGNLYTSVAPRVGTLSPQSELERNLAFNSAPLFSKINLRTGQIRLFGNEINNRFLDNDEINASGTNYFVQDNGDVSIISIFSDSVYSLSKTGKKLISRQVKSSDGSLFLKPFTFTNYRADPSQFTRSAISSSFISTHFYDAFKEVYLFLVRRPKINDDYFPHTLLIYNKDFQKLTEIDLKEKYNGIGFLAKKGLYLQRLPEGDMKTRTYDLITYE